MTQRSVRVGQGGRIAIWIARIALYLCLVIPRSAFGQIPVVHAEFATPNSETPITEWQFVGPFLFDKKDLSAPDAESLPVGLNRDYLSGFGKAETSIDAATFLELKAATGINLDSRFRNELVHVTPKTNILELANRRNPLDYVAGYLAVVIESKQDQEIAIAAGVDDNMQVWLNHDLVFSDLNTAGHFMKKFQRLIGAKLRKGNNFLLVKAGNLDRDWRVIFTLYPHARALELAHDNGVNPILLSSVVATGQPLRFRGDLLPTSQSRLEIADVQHVVIDSAELQAVRNPIREIKQLEKNKVYYCRVVVAGETIERPFYYGDLDAGYQRLSERVAHFVTSSDTVALDLLTILARLQHLLKTESRTSESWDQKVAASFLEVEDNLVELNGGPEVFRHAAGTHLRGYRSSVDGQIQHYWIHIPEKSLHSGKPIPIVIALPWTAYSNLPFIEGAHVAAFDETERYRILGDEFQFAVLQVWARGNYLGGTAIAIADVLEALDAVSQDYPIDRERVYLLGYCEAGRQALLLAERLPGRFAAVAVDGPITVVHGRLPYDQVWAEYASPVASVGNLVGTPVFITHEENEDPPLQQSVDFVSRAQTSGINVTLVRRHGGEHGFSQDAMGVKRSLFEFFRGRQRATVEHRAPTIGDLARFGIGNGPIEDVFGASILVVEGTLGTPEQQHVVHDLLEEIQDEWRKAYFVECPRKRDVEVTEDDVEKYNLILIGDKDTNSVLARMSGRLFFEQKATSISLAGKTYSGPRLGYTFVSKNPLNPTKYMVIVGMNQWQPSKEWKLHLSRYGICDYFVFDLQGPRPRLLDAGYFDGSWWDSTAASPTGVPLPKDVSEQAEKTKPE